MENAQHEMKEKIKEGCVTCSLCKKSFASETNRKLHIKAYHSNIKSPDVICVENNERSLNVDKNDEYIPEPISISSSSAVWPPETNTFAAQLWDVFLTSSKQLPLITPKYIPTSIRACYSITDENEYFDPSSPMAPGNQCESNINNLLDHEWFDLATPDNEVNSNKSNDTDTYTEISNNIYIDSVKKTILPHCNCDECDDSCIDHLLKIECDPKTCSCDTAKCNNMKMRKNIMVKVERFKTEEKGWGVRAKEFIPKEAFVMEYVGEVIKESSFKKQLATRYHSYQHSFCVKLGDGLVINGYEKGNICRFVNHSCRPNCKLEKWAVDGSTRLALYSQKDIQEGDELSYDYNFESFNPLENQICKCRSDDCRGFISRKCVQPNSTTKTRKMKAQFTKALELKPTNKANPKKPNKKLRFKLPLQNRKRKKSIIENSPHEIKTRVNAARKNSQLQF